MQRRQAAHQTTAGQVAGVSAAISLGCKEPSPRPQPVKVAADDVAARERSREQAGLAFRRKTSAR
jgi:hypothetical protein